MFRSYMAIMIRREIKKIVIEKVDKPMQADLNKELQWFSKSLGLFDSKRDKEKSCFRVFITLIRYKKGLRSDEIAANANLSRGTVIHHIHNLAEKGIVDSKKNKYFLRYNDFEDLIKEIHRNTERMFKDMENIAKKLDKELGF